MPHLVQSAAGCAAPPGHPAGGGGASAVLPILRLWAPAKGQGGCRLLSVPWERFVCGKSEANCETDPLHPSPAAPECNLAPPSCCQLTPQYCNKLKCGGCGLLLCWCCGEVIGEQRAYDHFADGACLVTYHVKLTAAGAKRAFSAVSQPLRWSPHRSVGRCES